MPAPRNDAKAAAMYALYQQGFSLSQVAKAFGVTRQGVYKMFAIRGFVMRSVEPLPFILWNGGKYTPRKDGYYRSTVGGRGYLHQDIWVFHNGAIPDGHEVHHRDEDKSNNDIGNLELLTSEDHGRLHSATNTGFQRTQFKLGRKGQHYPRRAK